VRTVGQAHARAGLKGYDSGSVHETACFNVQRVSEQKCVFIEYAPRKPVSAGANRTPPHAANFSPEYVAVLHDLATAYHDKLSELLRASGVEAFRVLTADKILRNLRPKYADDASELLDK